MTTREWPKKWAGQQWSASDKGQPASVTEEELKKLYLAIPAGRRAMLEALGVSQMQSRRMDRALALLKNEQLISYNKGTRKWYVNEPVVTFESPTQVVEHPAIPAEALQPAEPTASVA